jgi:molybdopterin-guanine dinucleotide biosynthesis protein A
VALRAQGHAGAVVVLAVDLPRVGDGLIGWLTQHPAATSVVPVVGGRMQTLCARYERDALDAAVQLVAAGECSMRALVAATPVHAAHEDEWRSIGDAAMFADVDTPTDAARLGIAVPPA